MAADPDFLILAVTPEHPFPGEADKIAELLDSDVDLVHLRHPQADADAFRQILDEIPARLHPRIKLHSHFSLMGEYHLGGVHLNHRWPVCNLDCDMSKSCHSLEELADADKYCYVTLSPIFDSISKQGYTSRFDLEKLKGNLPAKNVIALGGVRRQHLPALKAAGFAGAMMSGAIFG